MRKAMLLFMCLVAPLCALGQSNYLTITTATANEISDASGIGITGTFCAYATDQYDAPIAFTVGSTYQAVKSTVCVNISSGQFTATYTLANPAATTPSGIRYHVTITNTKKGTKTEYLGVSIVAGDTEISWDWSRWNPATGSASIPVNVVPGVTWKGEWDGTTAYSLNDGVSYNGSSYISTIAGNLNEPDGDGWQILAHVGATGLTCITDGDGSTCDIGNTKLKSASVETGDVHATTLAARNIVQPTYYPSAINAYGDSTTARYNASSIDKRWVNLVAGTLNLSTINVWAVGGEHMCSVNALQIFPNDSPTVAAQQPLRTLMAGTNDAGSAPGGLNQRMYQLCQKAAITWLTVPSASKVFGSAATTTGTCSTDTTYPAVSGVICSSSGSTASFGLTTTGKPIYIWYRVIDSDTGTFTYRVDGGATTALSSVLTSGTYDEVGQTGSTVINHNGIYLERITGISPGTHTVSFEQTSAGTMGILAVGTPSDMPYVAAPYLIVGDIPPQKDGANASNLAAYRQYVYDDIAEAQSDGLNVALAPTTQYVQMTTAAGDASDTKHPNDLGETEYAAAFLAPLKLQNQPLTSIAARQIQLVNAVYSTDHTVTSADGYIFVSGSTVTLPTSGLISGFTVKILNFSSVNSSAISGAVHGIPSSLGPYQSVEVVYKNGTWYLGSTGGISKATSIFPSSAIAANAHTVTDNDTYLLVTGGGVITFPSTELTSGLTITIINYGGAGAETLIGLPGSMVASLPEGKTLTVMYKNGGWYYVSGYTGEQAVITAGPMQMRLAPSISSTLAASTTYFTAGSGVINAAASAFASAKFRVEYACTVKSVTYYSHCGANPSGGTCCSVSLATSINGSSTFASATQDWTAVGSAQTISVVGSLAQVLAEGDYIAVQATTPAWTTAPTTCIVTATVACE